MLNGTIRHHLKKFVESNQKFITKFIEDLYVDDTTSGCSSVDKEMKFYQKSKTIMLAGGINLRKWVTNDPVLQEYFNKNENVENNFGMILWFSTKFKLHKNSKIYFCCYNRENKVPPVTWLL